MCRMGEAQCPGPIIGTTNPCGLLGKADQCRQLPRDDSGYGTWAAAETHLTRPGLTRFRDELRHLSVPFRVVAGPPAPPVNGGRATIGGKATGVAVLSPHPSRALDQSWPSELWHTGRIQASTVLIGGRWIKIGTLYGYANAPTTRNTRNNTDKLLEQLVQRIGIESHGCRIICGDWNQEYGVLPQQNILESLGFVEIQKYASYKWNRPIAPTCKGKTVRDYMFVSSELLPWLESVETDDTIFADHAILYGKFRAFHQQPMVPIWRTPKELPWDDVLDPENPMLPGHGELKVSADTSHDPNEVVRSIMQRMERRVDAALKAKGNTGLLPIHQGRCTTVAPRLGQAVIAPPKKARTHDYQVEYQGEHFQHGLWLRQLRRLQSLVRLLQSNKTGYEVNKARADLWQSIRAAQGFPGGFPHAWRNRASVTHSDLPELPQLVPSASQVQQILTSFLCEFRSLERLLNSHRRTQARMRREGDPTIIFKDLAKPRAVPVHTLVTTVQYNVLEVAEDRTQVKVDQPLAPDEPVYHAGCLLVHHGIASDILTIQGDHAIEEGENLSQQVFVGSHSEIFDAFKAVWNPLWNKHQHVAPDRWDEAITLVDELVTNQVGEMPWAPLSVDQWLATLKSKKRHSATGPDGVSRLDLLSMPADLTAELVTLVNQCEAGNQPWPEVCNTGLIALLEKHQSAQTAKDYRPITVLSQIYRTWASCRTRQVLQWLMQFCPEGLCGNKPGSCTTDIWWMLSQELESCHYGDEDATGIITDLIYKKAFNTIPRAVVYAIALKLGLPCAFVRHWHQTIHLLQRRFLVQGSCSPPLLSSTGYPEGDPLSVVAMLLLNVFMHAYVTDRSGVAKVISYVDNWEVGDSSAQTSHAAMQAMRNFCDLTDLVIDDTKTFGWGTSAESRKLLKQVGYAVKLDATELGGHVVFCKRPSLTTLKKRLQGVQSLWTWLERSMAPHHQKLQSLFTVAWPRCLHGVESLEVATYHFGKLRAATMAALKWDKQGASSTLQFGLSIDPRVDPEFYALEKTILAYRRLCNPDLCFPVMHFLVANPPNRRVTGPCGAVLSRLRQIGWRWHPDGYVLDHDHFAIDLLGAPLQWVRLRLREAWHVMVGQQLHNRDTFQGLAWVDVQCTLATIDSYTHEQQGLLRAMHNGTFFTRDKQFHGGKLVSKQCPWCSEQDSIAHRHWECPHFQDIRDEMPTDQLKYFANTPDCTRLRGWMTKSQLDHAFRTAITAIPDTCEAFDPPMQIPSHLHCFTDGSCVQPTQPRLRIATWAVALADEDLTGYHTISAGGVPGPLQTVLRAEVVAATSAVAFAVTHCRDITVWTDNLLVFRRMTGYLRGHHTFLTNMQKDHDVWNRLFQQLELLKVQGNHANVAKVTSHQDERLYTDVVDRWVCAGNDAADRAATYAFQFLPPQVLSTHAAYQQELANRAELRDALFKMTVAIGQRVISEKDELQVQAEAEWDLRPPVAPVTEAVSFVQMPERGRLGQFQPHRLGDLSFVIFDWLQLLSNSNAGVPVWMSSYQLYIHFQCSMKHMGFCYQNDIRKWVPLQPIAELQGFDFLRGSRWFVAALRLWCTIHGVEYVTDYRVPAGSSFRAWARCIHVRMQPSTVQWIDGILRSRGVSAVHSVPRSLGDLENFCEDHYP